VFSRVAPLPKPAFWSASTSEARQNVLAGAISQPNVSGETSN